MVNMDRETIQRIVKKQIMKFPGLKGVNHHMGSLFSEMGFAADEAELRTRAFVVYFSLEGGLFVGQSKRKRSEQLKRLHTFFTRR